MTLPVTGQDSELSTPIVSVIIPTHNRGEMLRRAIRSVLAQTWKNFELIVVSDGSKDNTEEVVRSFKDPRIRFFKHETPKGASAARNTGIRASSGKYLAFLDDDDEWVPQKLEIQMRLIESTGPEVGLVYAWMEYVRDGKVADSRKPTLRGNIFREMLDKQAIGGCPTIMIKHKVLDIVQGFDEELPRGNDGDFIRRIAKHFEVDYVPEVLVKVHVGHSDRISVDSRKNLKNVVFALEKRLQDFEEDFTRYPEQKANVLAQAGAACFKTGQCQKGLVYCRHVLQCKTSWAHRARLLCQVAKSIAKPLTGKFFFR